MKQKLPFFVQTVVLLSFKAHSFFVFFIFASRFGYSGSLGYHGTLPHCLTAGFYHGVSQLARVRDAGGLGLQSLLGWRMRSLLNRVMCSAGQSCSQQCYVLIARYGAHARGWSPRARRARKALFLGLSKRADYRGVRAMAMRVICMKRLGAARGMGRDLVNHAFFWDGI